MEKKQIEEKMKDFQNRHAVAVKEFERVKTLVVQLEGAILGCQEMLKDMEPKPNKK